MWITYQDVVDSRRDHAWQARGAEVWVRRNPPMMGTTIRA